MVVTSCSLFYLSLAFISCTETTGEIIISQNVTNWGKWADKFEFCPEKQPVRAFQLKTQNPSALFDNTALNAVKFYCGPPLGSNTVTITSTEGLNGQYNKLFSCGGGYIIGFQLRVQKPGTGATLDETATNNFRGYCSNFDSFIAGDGGTLGEWGTPVKCSKGKAICAIKTQVQKDSGPLIDDTALNNVAAKCCLIPE